MKASSGNGAVKPMAGASTRRRSTSTVTSSAGSASIAALEVTVDVERLLVEAPAIGFSAPFPLDAFTQHRLLEGLDDIGLTLRHEPYITAFEATRGDLLPTTQP